MEKNRQIKSIAIVALIVAVVGLGVGFAAFSSTLTINSVANVSPDASNFVVRFSSKSDSFDSTSITPEITGKAVSSSGAAITGETKLSIAQGAVQLFAPGDSLTYNFYVRNDGEYTAYLNSFVLGSVTCTRLGNAATQSLVDEACKSINPKFCIETTSGQEYCTNEGATNILDFGIAPFILNKGTVVAAKFIIEYASDGARADGPFLVNIGDVVLTYSSVRQ